MRNPKGEEKCLPTLSPSQNRDQVSTKRKKSAKDDTKEDTATNLRMQKVLSGRVFDPEIIRKPSMSTLADIVEI